MATAIECTANHIMEWREKAILKIVNCCIKREWVEAESLNEKYKEYCKPYWKEYDTHFNGKFNKCGFCMRMKRSLVRSKWSCSEQYPIKGQLVCVNEHCKFFLIINSDFENDL